MSFLGRTEEQELSACCVTHLYSNALLSSKNGSPHHCEYRLIILFGKTKNALRNLQFRGAAYKRPNCHGNTELIAKRPALQNNILPA